MLMRFIWYEVTLFGYLIMIIGYLLPWGPGDPEFRGGLTTTGSWGAKMSNTTSDPISLGGDLQLLPGETLNLGPGRSAKILAPDGGTRIIAGRKLKGTDMGLWGDAIFVLIVVGTSFAAVAVRTKYAAFARSVIPLVSGTALLVPVLLVIMKTFPVMREGKSFSRAFELFAPFGSVSFCISLILTAFGATLALVATVALLRISRPS